MLEPALTHDEDHRAFRSVRDEGGTFLEVKSETASADELDAGYEDGLCDICIWAVAHIAAQCCDAGSSPWEISCDPHKPSCENNVTYSLMRRIAHTREKNRKNPCWQGSLFCSGRREMWDRVWSDLTGLGNILHDWQRIRPMKPNEALAAFEICRLDVSETYDCVGDVDVEDVHQGKLQQRDLPNSDVKLQKHRKKVCKGAKLSKKDLFKGCPFEDKRCLKTTKHWRTKRLCSGLYRPKGEHITAESVKAYNYDGEEEEEDEDEDDDDSPKDVSPEEAQKEVVKFEADEDLGFPELEITWDEASKGWTAANGKFNKENNDCLAALGEEPNIAQFLGNGTSQKLVKEMCIFLHQLGESDTDGSWFLENVPENVRGMLRKVYSGASLSGFLFKSLLTMQDELQNVGFGSHLVKKVNKVTSKYDQKGVMAYETRNMDKKIHYIRHFVHSYKVDLETVEGLQGCEDQAVPPDTPEESCIKKAAEIFPTYNHFFYRKLALGSRKMICYSQDADECSTIDADARATKSLVSPADGRVIVFPDFVPASTGFWVKGEQFLLQSLVKFNHDSDYKYYEHGVAFIVRLAPQDYHRFHFPVDGKINSFENYPGNYYSVNPIAVQSTDPVFTTNKRMHVTLDTGEDNLGCVTYVSVGATNVGSVMHTSYVGQDVLRGMEHGYMAFGGSTVLVFVRRGVLDVVDPIRDMSAVPVETIVHLGDELAKQKAKEDKARLPPSPMATSPCTR
ncbi:PSD3, partial [Symbiodinium pilosum]